MADRLRELLDLVIRSVYDPQASGRRLAEEANLSRDHLDRLLSAAVGETPVALRRRLLLERAAWQLRVGGLSATEVARAAGYSSLPPFTRAFSAAYGCPPSAFAASQRTIILRSPNGVHFHPPAGLVIPGAAMRTQRMGLTSRLVDHHLDRSRELLEAAATLPAEALERPLRPGFVVLPFDGEEPSAALMAERLVLMLEVWVAAMAGRPHPEGEGELLPRFEAAAKAFARLVRGIRDRDAWDDAFVDALCEPPQSFTYGGVVAHVISFGAVRREMLASVLAELGVAVPDTADPIAWEMARGPMAQAATGIG